MYQSRFGLSREDRDSTTRVFVGGVVNDQVHDEAHPPLVDPLQEAVEVRQRAEHGVDVVVVGDVVALSACGDA